MKKITLLLLISTLTLGASAQIDSLYNKQPVNKMASFIKDINTALPNYKLDYTDKSVYRFTDSAKNNIVLVVQTSMIGENKDLEVKGYEGIIMPQISGPFLALYAIWDKYFNDGSTKDEILKQDRVFTKSGVRFERYNEKWRIYKW